MPMLGPWELIIILVIVVVIFGAGRLSEVGGAMGKGIREFRRATNDEPVGAIAPVAPPPPPPVAASPVLPSLVPENKCPSCGTVNPGTQAFCGQCGTRLTVVAA